MSHIYISIEISINGKYLLDAYLYVILSKVIAVRHEQPTAGKAQTRSFMMNFQLATGQVSPADSTGGRNTYNCISSGSVADEAKTSDLLYGKPESTDVGALAKR